MAITATSVETTGVNTDLTSYPTNLQTPTADRLQLLWVYSIAAAAPNTPTVTGCNLTWVEVDNQIDSGSLRKITLFRALGAIPTLGLLTIDFAGQTQTGCAWSWVEYDGIDISGTNGSGAIVQSAKNATAVNATSLTVTLAAFSDASNATVGGFGIPLNTAATPVVGSGFTATGQRNQNNPNLSIGSEFLASNDTSVDMTSGAVVFLGLVSLLS